MAIVTVKEAIRRLKNNQVVGIPTETVYGLAGRISSPDALRLIFTTKERPLFDPLIVHVADIEQAKTMVKSWPKAVGLLAEKFWPGPLTFVLPKSHKIDSLITSGLPTVGIRAPAHPIALEILRELGEPIAAPSANKFGQTSPTRAEHVLSEFNEHVAVVDGGPCEVGIESTVVRWKEGAPPTLEILRPGGVSRDQLFEAIKELGEPVNIEVVKSKASPGNLDHHYQPALPMVLVRGKPSKEMHLEAARAIGVATEKLWEMKLPDDARLAARELYQQLHTLSNRREGGIVFWTPDPWESPEWEALRDRITRASTQVISEEF